MATDFLPCSSTRPAKTSNTDTPAISLRLAPSAARTILAAATSRSTTKAKSRRTGCRSDSDSGGLVLVGFVRGAGIARLYALDYQTGAAIYWDWHHDTKDGEVIKTPVTADRSIQIGTTIPSAPVIAILDGGPQLFVAAGGGGGGGPCTGPLCKFEPKRKFDMNLFYWWQQLS